MAKSDIALVAQRTVRSGKLGSRACDLLAPVCCRRTTAGLAEHIPARQCQNGLGRALTLGQNMHTCTGPVRTAKAGTQKVRQPFFWQTMRLYALRAGAYSASCGQALTEPASHAPTPASAAKQRQVANAAVKQDEIYFRSSCNFMKFLIRANTRTGHIRQNSNGRFGDTQRQKCADVNASRSDRQLNDLGEITRGDQAACRLFHARSKRTSLRIWDVGQGRRIWTSQAVCGLQNLRLSVTQCCKQQHIGKHHQPKCFALHRHRAQV